MKLNTDIAIKHALRAEDPALAALISDTFRRNGLHSRDLDNRIVAATEDPWMVQEFEQLLARADDEHIDGALPPNAAALGLVDDGGRRG